MSQGTPGLIGKAIRIKGELHGEEDLIIEGKVEGTIALKKNHLILERSAVIARLEHESRFECTRFYLTYLHLYLRFYSMLSERERRALHMIEVEERSYREAADELGIRLENLKMVIFRARRKIHRSMRRVFEGLPADLRPARDPAASRQAENDTEGDDKDESMDTVFCESEELG